MCTVRWDRSCSRKFALQRLNQSPLNISIAEPVQSCMSLSVEERAHLRTSISVDGSSTRGKRSRYLEGGWERVARNA